MKQIVMPQLGENMKEATLLNWCIQEGDTFQQEDVIFEIETEKVAFDVEVTGANGMEFRCVPVLLVPSSFQGEPFPKSSHSRVRF